MAGYTNSFTALDGDLITAALFQNEYTALDAAFDETTGHTHDGTVGGGAYISVLADSNDFNEVLCNAGSSSIDFSVEVTGAKETQLSIVNGAIVPTLSNNVDLGSNLLQFKDIYSSGTANLSTATVTGLASLDGGIDVDNTGSVFSVDGTTGATDIAGYLHLAGELQFGVTQAVTAIDNDGAMTANLATNLVTQSAVITYVGTAVTDATIDGGTY